MTPRFFIDRPVFAWVIAIGILLAGLMALRALPVEQYPDIAPPSLTIRASYPGADAAVVESNVTQVIEQEISGIEGFRYMTASSQATGGAAITVTFDPGTDIDTAQMTVQNLISSVEQRLPEEVRRQGLRVTKASSGFLMIVGLTSRSGATDGLELGNFAKTRVEQELRRLPGVGDIQSFAPEFAMRVWLDPERLANLGMSPADALAAVREQNSQSAGGALGDQPIRAGAEINATILTQDRFTTPQEFAAIILRANPDGSAVRLGDVARVELGAQSYLFGMTVDGKPAAGMAVSMTTGANALETADGVIERMEELAGAFPEDIDWTISYDTTPFIRISIEEVAKTLLEAMALVFIVMFLFLQSWRATIIPSLVVPIALAGACLGLWIGGFSINVLSLFAMVISIGILVDDAIVVVENVERIMREEALPPREATVKAMGQITSPIIGISLVLVAVFVPMAFFPGSTGGIYRQFSLTLTLSIAFSALLALTLTPALCATLLRPHPAASADHAAGGRGLGKRVLGGFNRWFERSTGRYQSGVRHILLRPLRFVGVYVVLVAVGVLLFLRLPGSFLPTEDQGVVLTVIQAPPGATSQRTNEAVEQVQAFYSAQPQVRAVSTVQGFSFYGQGQANAMAFVALHPWGQRDGEANSANTLVARSMGALGGIPEAMVFSLNPPAIAGLGVSSGFSLSLQDRGGHGRAALLAAQDALLAAAAGSSVVTQVRSEAQVDAPQLRVIIDRIQARALGLSITDVNATLAITFGSAYANDFSREGRIHRVLLQAESAQRMTPDDVLALRVRSADGRMVPFGAFTSVQWTAGPTQLDRYNGYPAVTISGSPATGRSTGEAMNEMERLASDLPEGFGVQWTGISLEEKEAAGQVAGLLTLSFVVVFLLLAALYESWSTPLAVLLVVPLGLLGAALASMSRGLPADVYLNVGLIAIIGLAAKNAILIVEFALEEEAAGKGPFDATLTAVKLRLRPIIMTSLAFILGMVPLVTASGAGAASRIAVGTGVMGGMIAATLLGIFFIPLAYLCVRRWLGRRPRVAATPDPGR